MRKIFFVVIALLYSFISANAVFAAADTWTQKADFGGTARLSAVGFSIDDKGYIGTGLDGPLIGATRRKDFWEYDPVANSWTQKADFGGTARVNAAGFSIGNKGYIGTGMDGSYRKDFWEYDPVANSWTQKADFGGVGRYCAVGFSIGNKGYIGTGYDGSFRRKDFWEYDPAKDTWTQKANFGGNARSDAAGFSVGSKGYIGTGSDSSGLLKDFWEYNPETNNWSQKADVSTINRSKATGFSIGNLGYIGMGWVPNANGSYGKDFLEYDPAVNVWTKKADFGGTARSYAVGFSVQGKGYVGIGYNGLDGTQKHKDFWEYEPTENTPIVTSNLIDFESPDRNYDTLELEGVGLTYSEEGYTFTDVIGPEEPYPQNTYLHYVGGQYRYPPCSVALVADSSYSTVTLTRNDGRPFSIAGIELNEMWGEEYPAPTVLFTGKKVNGDIVAQTFTLDGKNKNGGEFFIFPQSFSNLISIQVGYYKYPYSFDNLVVFESPAMEPDHQSVAADAWDKLNENCKLCDTIPNPFIFNFEAGVDLNAVITSNAVTVSGINAPTTVSITGGIYSINDGAYTSKIGKVNNGDTVTVQQTSSGSYETTTVATLTIGGVSDTFSVTTKVPSIISLSPVADPTVIWPPNNKMVKVNIMANATDSSGEPVTLTAKVSCNESARLGRDWTQPVINQKTGLISLSLLASRAGNGTGRIYTITITATGTEGNAAIKTVTVTVPHDQQSTTLVSTLRR